MNEKEIKISIGYDSVIASGPGKEFILELMSFDINIFIIVERIKDEYSITPKWNKDVYERTDSLKIPRENVKFTSFSPVRNTIEQVEPLIHIGNSSLLERIGFMYNVFKLNSLFPYENHKRKIANRIKSVAKNNDWILSDKVMEYINKYG